MTGKVLKLIVSRGLLCTIDRWRKEPAMSIVKATYCCFSKFGARNFEFENTFANADEAKGYAYKLPENEGIKGMQGNLVSVFVDGRRIR